MENIKREGKLTIIGAGLAGCEAAWHAANHGIKVTLCVMKPQKYTPAHRSGNFAELICSNSLKAERIESAGGLLKAEMKRLGSICIDSAYQCRVPAGGALAVDRYSFSKTITDKIKAHPNITVQTGEITEIPDGICIIASGPLTSEKLSESIAKLTKADYLNFYDAAAPIVTFDSIDMNKAFFGSRYDRGGDDDYINCPMDKEQYEAFYNELINAERAKLHDADQVYEGCMPVEIMAKRGADTLRFGPLKPVGLKDPNTGHRPWAVVQLRRENSTGSMYNIVGFQTNLKFGEQKRVFSMIPALKDAEFGRYGVMHRNTFLDSPRLLNKDLSLKNDDRIYFAGQITGVEGYMESAACGIIAGINAVRRINGKPAIKLPETTMIGSLLKYITDESVTDFQPMGANFGIMPQLTERIKDKKQRYGKLADKALKAYENINLD